MHISATPRFSGVRPYKPSQEPSQNGLDPSFKPADESLVLHPRALKKMPENLVDYKSKLYEALQKNAGEDVYILSNGANHFMESPDSLEHRNYSIIEAMTEEDGGADMEYFLLKCQEFIEGKRRFY